MFKHKISLCIVLLISIEISSVAHAQLQQPADDQSIVVDKTTNRPAYSNRMQTGLSSPQCIDASNELACQGDDDRLRARVHAQSDEQAQSWRRETLPAEPPTEFQQMVWNSTGRLLAIYGADMFRHVPSTFAPADKVPVTPEYVIGPGDELLLQVWGQVALNSRLTVDRSGSIYVPQVGVIPVTGIAFGKLQEYLKSQFGRVFKNFDLNVNLGQLKSIQIFVVGQARQPGSYTISSLSTLVDALFVTGGPSKQGSLRHIQLKRSGKVVADFDLYSLLQSGDEANDLQLLPGDVIYIPPVGPQVAVAGSVRLPGIYELKSSGTSTVSEALDLAAGLTSVASDGNMRLERVDAHQMRSLVDIAARPGWRSERIQDGDILEFTSITGRYRNSVTLRGNVANPGRFFWKEGMRVRDLIPDETSLITQNYWLKREQLGNPALTYLPACPESSQGIENPVLQGASFTGDRLQDCRRKSESAEGIQRDAALSKNATPRNSQDGDSRTQKNDLETSGASAADAMVAKSPREFEAQNNVVLSEPDIDWNYAVIERQDKDTLTTSLLPFNLGKLILERDESQNLPLEPNDVVTIFSKADIRVPQTQQTRLVRLEGEFVSSGIYSVLPGETLRDLVRRAGGLTTHAYLYGSEFTRESTQRVQQQKLKEYIDQIALQTSTNSANAANRAVSALDSAASATAAAQSMNIVTSLRQTKASGRIVLQLLPDSNRVEDLPQIELEDGDRFVVPQMPSTVSVAGAVYSPGTFLYDQSRRLKDYLELAGGANRDAERKSAYLIRADGSVVSRLGFSYLRKNDFELLPIYPGDSIIVPLNLSKGTGLRNVVDIAQIVGQFGIAAAATSVVF